jgi:hypothetical protein
MIDTFLPIAVLAAVSLGGAQPAAIVIRPRSPILMQLTQVSLPDPQVKVSVPDPKVKVKVNVKDDLFAGTEKFAQGASESTEINLDPDTMDMVGSGHRNSELAKKMKFMTIRAYEYDKPGMYKMEDVEAYRKKLEDGTWKCSVRVREKNESTDICSRIGPDHETREMVILTAEPKELTFIHMSGNMSLDDLNKAANGLQHR